MNNKLGVFLAGGLIGAGVALFYAPRTGVETRAMVADKAQAMWGQAQGLGAQVAVDAQQFYGNAAQNAQQVYGAAATQRRCYRIGAIIKENARANASVAVMLKRKTAAQKMGCARRVEPSTPPYRATSAKTQAISGFAQNT